MMPDTLRWENGCLKLLDQRLLPGEIVYRSCRTAEQVAGAINKMVVRGAPAIGISAAFGLVLAAYRVAEENPGRREFVLALNAASEKLRRSRPTAVNLHWGLQRILARLEESDSTDLLELAACLEEEACSIFEEDMVTNRRLGDLGAELIPPGASLLTHCNAGALATGGYGTALGVIRSAFKQGKVLRVYASETRPFLQGARLTSFELVREGIPSTLIIDNCAAHLMAKRKVDLVIVGADRIAANGDTANKIGTYSLAVLARHHRIPFYVAAPCSTIDRTLPDGEKIVIEERGPEEITGTGGEAVAPTGIEAYNPAFDVTPAALVSALITEKAVIRQPDQDKVNSLFL